MGGFVGVPGAPSGAVLSRVGSGDYGRGMRAVVVSRFGGPEVLEIAEVPMPEPGPGRVRIRVAASAVNPIDLSTRSGLITGAGLMAPAERVSIGWDVAGHVDAVGAHVTSFAVGDAIVGLRDLLFEVPGAAADCVILDEHGIAEAPRAASMAEAATAPLAGLTAARSLTLAGLRPGQTLLVTGAAGAVGGFALELARMQGLRTVALARSSDEALVRSLGATQFVPAGGELSARVRELVPGGVTRSSTLLCSASKPTRHCAAAAPSSRWCAPSPRRRFAARPWSCRRSSQMGRCSLSSWRSSTRAG